MGGNPNLKGKSRDPNQSGDPWAYRFEGKITNGECLFDLYVSHPDALDQKTLLLDASRSAQLTILIDTGATASCIRPDIARNLKLPVLGQQNVSGVNSKKACDLVAVLFLITQQNKMHAKLMPMIVADIDVPMILGMSEIQQGVLIVDGPKGNWKWSLPHAGFTSPPPRPPK